MTSSYSVESPNETESTSASSKRDGVTTKLPLSVSRLKVILTSSTTSTTSSPESSSTIYLYLTTGESEAS